MRAKLVYEAFSEDGDPIEDMGIGSHRYLIKQWFETYAPEVKYTIDNKLNIAITGLLNLSYTKATEIPDNLIVANSLHMEGSAIIKLPNNLRVGGGLDAKRSALIELPENLIVRTYLDIQGTKITKLPDNLKLTAWLDISDTMIAELPKDIDVLGAIYYKNTPLSIRGSHLK